MEQKEMAWPQASRNTDPETSHMAERQHTASGKRETHRARVCGALQAIQAGTYAEIAEAAEMDPVEVMRRLNDLQRQGDVEKLSERRRCAVKGTMCSVWAPRL